MPQKRRVGRVSTKIDDRLRLRERHGELARMAARGTITPREATFRE